jgi:hypothetical protein
MMAIMASLNQKNRLFDPIRKKWVVATPEEHIRQHLLLYMLESLGYPRRYITVEKEIALLPHLKSGLMTDIAKRRADILVCAPKSFAPLLLIECKAVPLTETCMQQVIGYNSFVDAPFVSLANGEEVLTGHYQSQTQTYHFEKGLPSFESLAL